jgi:hypothetical protein
MSTQPDAQRRELDGGQAAASIRHLTFACNVTIRPYTAYMVMPQSVLSNVLQEKVIMKISHTSFHSTPQQESANFSKAIHVASKANNSPSIAKTATTLHKGKLLHSAQQQQQGAAPSTKSVQKAWGRAMQMGAKKKAEKTGGNDGNSQHKKNIGKVSKNDGVITVVNLNSAGGLDHGKNETRGLDFNDADLSQSIDDLFGNGRDPDVITMQELPVKAVTGTPAGTPDIGYLEGIQQRLEEKTGDHWDIYYNTDTGNPHQYYRSERGNSDGDGIESSAGTVIFVRRGTGSDVEASSAILPSTVETENGVTYQNTEVHLPGSLVGVRLITKEGQELDVYTAHTGEGKSEQLEAVRETILANSGYCPVILTGDFNNEGENLPELTDNGFLDATKGDGYTAPNNRVLDHIFTRGFEVSDELTDVFAAPSSDHSGLVITADPEKDLPPQKRVGPRS